jgi:charged multivesicular body protein 3
MKVTEAFAVKKIEGSIKASTGIMRDVNSLVRLPELIGTMQDLERELVKAGVIEEMIDETLPEATMNEEDEEAAESEVDKVLGEVLKDRMAKVAPTPTEPTPVEEAEEEEEDPEEMLNQMRGRLEALKS